MRLAHYGIKLLKQGTGFDQSSQLPLRQFLCNLVHLVGDMTPDPLPQPSYKNIFPLDRADGVQLFFCELVGVLEMRELKQLA